MQEVEEDTNCQQKILFRGHMQPGYQFMQWDGKDMYGTPGPSGMYIVVMQAGEFIDTKKVILLK